jgi:hypothetical protein
VQKHLSTLFKGTRLCVWRVCVLCGIIQDLHRKPNLEKNQLTLYEDLARDKELVASGRYFKSLLKIDPYKYLYP